MGTAAGRLPPRVPAEQESTTRFTHIDIIPFHFVEQKTCKYTVLRTSTTRTRHLALR